MIEEFMLAANISVAEKILKHFPLCSLLRYLPSIFNLCWQFMNLSLVNVTYNILFLFIPQFIHSLWSNL
jgi:hypothetical protein